MDTKLSSPGAIVMGSHVETGTFNSNIFKGWYSNKEASVKKILSVSVDHKTIRKELAELLNVGEHENLLVYYGFEIQGRAVLLAMQECKTSLKTCLEKKSLPLSSFEIVRQTCQGLEYLHSKNFIHGNLKPSNILITTKNSTIKLSDFGMKHLIGDLVKCFVSRGSTIGVVDWMAPEVLESYHNDTGSSKTSSQGDIFSLGCIFFVIISNGIHPFGPLLHRPINILNGKPDLDQSIVNGLTKRTIPGILEMISHNPGSRPSAPTLLHLPTLTSGTLNPLKVVRIDYDMMLSSEVQFQGKSMPLNTVMPQLTLQDFKSIMENGDCEDQYIDIFITRQRKFELLHDTVPPLPVFYIPRTMSNSMKVDPEIFKQTCNDVFVLQDISIPKLSEFAGKNLISSSTSQLEEITSKFIILEVPEDWEKIRHILDVPVHLIRFEQETNSFVLVETSGKSEVLWQFLNNQETYISNYLSEQQLIIQTNESATLNKFCLCDSPGSGKTLLLASLAGLTAQLYPNNLVVFIRLNEFSQKMPPTATCFTHYDALSLLADYVSPSTLAKEILLTAISNKHVKANIFFDGFDELAQESALAIKSFLCAITTNDNIKIYVAARPHMRKDLETTFGVIAYHLLPFSRNDQVNFLVEFWKQEDTSLDHLKLTEFAEHCLSVFKSTQATSSTDMMGIPLWCYLLGEEFQIEAEMYVDHDYSASRYISWPQAKVFNICKQFISHCLQSSRVMEENLIKIKSFHVVQALQLLFPQIADQVSKYLNISLECIDQQAVLRVGVIQLHYKTHSRNTRFFIHRIVAEFLVADFFGSVLIGCSLDSENQIKLEETIIPFVFNTVLKTKEHVGLLSVQLKQCNQKTEYFPNVFPVYNFCFPEILNFLNCFLQGNQKPAFSSPMQRFFDSIQPFQLLAIFQCCCVHSNIYLLNFCVETILGMQNDTLKQCKEFLSAKLPKSDNDSKFALDPLQILFLTSAKFLGLAATEGVCRISRKICNIEPSDVFKAFPYP